MALAPGITLRMIHQSDAVWPKCVVIMMIDRLVSSITRISGRPRALPQADRGDDRGDQTQSDRLLERRGQVREEPVESAIHHAGIAAVEPGFDRRQHRGDGIRIRGFRGMRNRRVTQSGRRDENGEDHRRERQLHRGAARERTVFKTLDNDDPCGADCDGQREEKSM